jgi:hypothetical protein
MGRNQAYIEIHHRRLNGKKSMEAHVAKLNEFVT